MTLGWRVRSAFRKGYYLHEPPPWEIRRGFDRGRGILFFDRDEAVRARETHGGIIVRIIAKPARYVIRRRNPIVYTDAGSAIEVARGFQGGLADWKIVRLRKKP